MIEIIIGTTKYGFNQINTIITSRPDCVQEPIKVWITLKVDEPPQTNVPVIVDKEGEPGYFTGEVQGVHRLEKGKYEVFCLGAQDVNPKAGVRRAPKSDLSPISDESPPRQRTRRRKVTK